MDENDRQSEISEIEPLSPSEQQCDDTKLDAHQNPGSKPEETLRNRRRHIPSSNGTNASENGDENPSMEVKNEGTSPNVFMFWACFVGIVSLITLFFLLTSSFAGPENEKAEFLSMPPDLRSHYFKGKMVKVQIGAEEKQSIQVFVRQEGPRDAETVLLVHGFGASSFSFRDVISILASKGIHAVALDLPGFGFSDKSSLQTDRRWGGLIGRVKDVYLDIKEKGLFWGFDQLVETGEMPYVQYEPRVTKSYQALQCAPQELSQSLKQVIDSLSLGPVHLVVHDTGFETGAIWAASNPSFVRSITLIDAAPHNPSVPSWVLKVPGVGELVTHFPLLQLGLLRMCCSKFMDRSVAEAHGILWRTKNGRRASVEIGNRANASFDLKSWADADSVKEVPMQILWGNNWSKDWQREGDQIAKVLPRAVFVSHSGGRWPQEDVAKEIAEALASFISSFPPTARTVTEEALPEHIQKMFDEVGGDHHHSNSDLHNHIHTHQHGHDHGDHGHSHGAAYMDGYGLGHGGWH